MPVCSRRATGPVLGFRRVVLGFRRVVLGFRRVQQAERRAWLASSGQKRCPSAAEAPTPSSWRLAVVASGEGDQVAAVGADRVPRLVGVGQVGEEVVDVAGNRVPGQHVPGGLFHPHAVVAG